MFRLRWLLIPLWVGCIAGAVVIAALSLGWVGWAPFVAGAAAGAALGIPAGIATTRYMRRHPRYGDGHQPSMRPDG